MTLADAELVRLAPPAPPRRDATSVEPARQTVRALLRRPGFLIAVAYVVLVVSARSSPRLFASYDPTQTAPKDKFLRAEPVTTCSAPTSSAATCSPAWCTAAPSRSRPPLTRVGLALVVGLTLGVVSGFVGGWADAC